MKRLACFALLLFASLPCLAQQVGDREFAPKVSPSAFAEGKGPVVCLDEAHHNFHTLDGRFHAFGALLRRDGYVVQPNRSVFDATSLSACAVLVIANAQPSDANWNDYPTPTPSAFAPAEIAAVREWVQGGGRLLLIADHMPLAGAALALAAAFDVEFSDGFAFAGVGDEAKAKPTLFRLDEGTLADHAILRGRNADEAIAQLRSFTGQAFRAPGAQPLMVLPAGFISLHPAKAWKFDDATPRVEVGGWLQGAVKHVGKGRAAFFGEAAMFTAQSTGTERRPMGMNSPDAEQNAQFVLNLLHWLAPPSAGSTSATHG
ncbi:DUF4350 domain-containing protein [Thermomonas carbonis]|uniref:DUF4350 domain-containing protein n=1 Tax=Thermomonas carbonis TaxID=1463158 RepID=A0A7G9STW9_9GAMM|nr:DUF4350 domain-containing protein [Thermomonas carbonis]QNN71294.1 DUF4350 domain-containing protein [Thermomonas carbonis]GHC10578.1 hypothetical protein GCM10010080_27690 [Thermomonas carbonis]